MPEGGAAWGLMGICLKGRGLGAAWGLMGICLKGRV